ncbi:MAG: hypothetical protein WAQ52_17765 [Terriglobales bacterium]
MKPTAEEPRTGANWPPEEGQVISFKSSDTWKTGILRGVRWGLVWRDFILDDGRVIPEHKIAGCPQPPVWRNIADVTQDERELWEERLVSMSEAGLDPRDREQTFWAELNQYLAHTYLRFKQAGQRDAGTTAATRPDEFPDQITDVKHVVIVRLSEMLELKADVRERESAAYSLGTLKKLETTLQANPPRRGEHRI